MVKRCLRKCETRKNFQFTTLLAEIEAILNLNSTYVYEDIESGLTLIPAHFCSFLGSESEAWSL